MADFLFFPRFHDLGKLALTRLFLPIRISFSNAMPNLRIRSYESADWLLGYFWNSTVLANSAFITFFFCGLLRPFSTDNVCGFMSSFRICSYFSSAFSLEANRKTLYVINNDLHHILHLRYKYLFYKNREGLASLSTLMFRFWDKGS